MIMLLIHILVLFFCCFHAEAARILAVFSMPVRSHFLFNEAVVKSLHAAGHEITLISPFATESTKNFTSINSKKNDTVIYVGLTPVFHFVDMNIISFLSIGMETDLKGCDTVLNLPFIRDLLKSNQKQYDLMIIQLFYLPQCYYPIAAKLGIPIIGTVPYRSWKLADAIMGLPHHPATLPVEVTGLQSLSTFQERFVNTWSDIITDVFCQIMGGYRLKQLYKKHFPDYDPTSQNIQPSILFINNHYTLMRRPLISNTFEVGGLHIEPANPLSQNEIDFESFISEAQHGVILFTLGSLIKGSSLPDSHRNAFVKAFAIIPQRVIWKYEDKIDGISDNVLLSSWVPQRDILEHKNVKAFISHCGISGMYEAIHTATPVISTPLFVDQTTNAALLEELGVAVRLDLRSVTIDKILNAINRVLQDTTYYEKMEDLSQKFKERPTSPQNIVVYWTNYVLKYKGAYHLQNVHQKMPLYQYLLLDVIVFSVAVIIMSVYLIIYVLRIVSMYFTSHQCSKNVTQKEKLN